MSLNAAMQQAYAAGRKPCFDADIRWRPDGHAVAAAALLPVLVDLAAAPIRQRSSWQVTLGGAGGADRRASDAATAQSSSKSSL